MFYVPIRTWLYFKILELIVKNFFVNGLHTVLKENLNGLFQKTLTSKD